MATKKEKKQVVADQGDGFETIATKKALNAFLIDIREKLEDGSAAAVYCVSAMNYVLNIPNIYTMLDKDNKEIARDIWLRLKSVGIQIKDPPLLFEAPVAKASTKTAAP